MLCQCNFLRTSEESHVKQLNSDETVVSNGEKVKKKKNKKIDV